MRSNNALFLKESGVLLVIIFWKHKYVYILYLFVYMTGYPKTANESPNAP